MMRISAENKDRLETIKRLNFLHSYDDAITLLFNSRDPVELHLRTWLYELGLKDMDIKWVNVSSGDYYKLYLYTDKNRYYIVANRDGSYLGAQWSPLDSLPDEGGRGGGDMADGIFSEETWNKILRDIVRQELEIGQEVEPEVE